jgi:cell division protein FtsB
MKLEYQRKLKQIEDENKIIEKENNDALKNKPYIEKVNSEY